MIHISNIPTFEKKKRAIWIINLSTTELNGFARILEIVSWNIT